MLCVILVTSYDISKVLSLENIRNITLSSPRLSKEILINSVLVNVKYRAWLHTMDGLDYVSKRAYRIF